MGIIENAQAQADARARAYRPIDYERMNAIFPKQKAALTRAVNAYHAVEATETDRRNFGYDDGPNEHLIKAREKVAEVCLAAKKEWNEIGAWPDDWARWQRALDDVMPWNQSILLEDLR